jgi:negative regulator of flagellin synthesis FlgM
MIDPVSKGPVNMGRTRHALATKMEPPVSRSVPLSRLLDTAAALARQGPPVDYARIAQIKQAIATGTYTVDADRIAATLLR